MLPGPGERQHLSSIFGEEELSRLLGIGGRSGSVRGTGGVQYGSSGGYQHNSGLQGIPGRGAPPNLGGSGGMPMPSGMPGMPGPGMPSPGMPRPGMPGGSPGTPGSFDLRLGGIGDRIRGGLGRVKGWAEENPELAGKVAGGIASTVGAYKEGQARDREVAWQQRQEEEKQRRKDEALEQMQQQWKDWGWI